MLKGTTWLSRRLLVLRPNMWDWWLSSWCGFSLLARGSLLCKHNLFLTQKSHLRPDCDCTEKLPTALTPVSTGSHYWHGMKLSSFVAAFASIALASWVMLTSIPESDQSKDRPRQGMKTELASCPPKPKSPTPKPNSWKNGMVFASLSTIDISVSQSKSPILPHPSKPSHLAGPALAFLSLENSSSWSLEGFDLLFPIPIPYASILI